MGASNLPGWPRRRRGLTEPAQPLTYIEPADEPEEPEGPEDWPTADAMTWRPGEAGERGPAIATGPEPRWPRITSPHVQGYGPADAETLPLPPNWETEPAPQLRPRSPVQWERIGTDDEPDATPQLPDGWIGPGEHPCPACGRLHLSASGAERPHPDMIPTDEQLERLKPGLAPLIHIDRRPHQ